MTYEPNNDGLNNLLFDFQKALTEYIKARLLEFKSSPLNTEVYAFILDLRPPYFYVFAGINTKSNFQKFKDSGVAGHAELIGFSSRKYDIDEFLIYDPCEGEEVSSWTQKISNYSSQIYELIADRNGDPLHSDEGAFYRSIQPKFIDSVVSSLKEIMPQLLVLDVTDDFVAFCKCSWDYSEEQNIEIAKRTIDDKTFNKVFGLPKLKQVDDFDPRDLDYLITQLKYHFLNTNEEQEAFHEKLIEQYKKAFNKVAPLHLKKLIEYVQEFTLSRPPCEEFSDEDHFVNLFSKEGQFFSFLFRGFYNVDKISETDTKNLRLLMDQICREPYRDSQKMMSIAPSSIAQILHNINPEVFPRPNSDGKTFYLLNYKEYLTKKT